MPISSAHSRPATPPAATLSERSSLSVITASHSFRPLLGMGSVVELELRVGGLKLWLVVITEREERSEIAAAGGVAGLL